MPLLSAHKPLAMFVAASLLNIANEERRGRRPARLTEPGFATWNQLRGRLNMLDLVEILLDDARVSQPYAFDLTRIKGDQGPHAWRALQEETVRELVAEVCDSHDHDAITRIATTLELHTRIARSELPRSIRPHHRVLELPGTGGQLARHLIHQQPDLSLREVFVIAAGDWREHLLAASIAVEANVEGEAPFLLVDPTLELARQLHAQQPFDYVVGLAPDKGGAHTHNALLAAFPAPERELHIHLV